MKFIHLSDLHIGKTIKNISMIPDQKYIFDEICHIIQKENIQGVLLSGDIYDTTRPSSEAIALFDSFLTKLVHLDTQIFIIRGNHDSPEQIAYFSGILHKSNIYVSPVFDKKNTSIRKCTISDEYGELNIILLPYIDRTTARACFPEAKIETWTDAVKAVLDTCEIDAYKRNILLSHQFVTGAIEGGSESRIIGTLENIEASIFADFDYVALGHIHRPQSVGGSDFIRYCGSPLKYSLSEANTKKSAPIIEIRNKSDKIDIRLHELIPVRDLRTVQGTFDEVMTSQPSEDYVYITLTDKHKTLDAHSKIRNVYPNFLELTYDCETSTVSRETSVNHTDIIQKTELDFFAELFVSQNGREMDNDEIEYLSNVINSLKSKD